MDSIDRMKIFLLVIAIILPFCLAAQAPPILRQSLTTNSAANPSAAGQTPVWNGTTWTMLSTNSTGGGGNDNLWTNDTVVLRTVDTNPPPPLRIGMAAGGNGVLGIPMSQYWNATNVGMGSIGLGSNVLTKAAWAAVLGGIKNEIDTNSIASVISGGATNVIRSNSFNCVIAGGWQNTITAGSLHSVIGGGFQNAINNAVDFSVIAGGQQNSIAEENAVIAGGAGNVVNIGATSAFIGAGNNHGAFDDNCFIGAGFNNTVKGDNAFIGGGMTNKVYGITTSGIASSIVGGRGNEIGQTPTSGANEAFIGGGNYNRIAADSSRSVIVGGSTHYIGAGSTNSFIGGGSGNSINDGTTHAAAILAGTQNNVTSAGDFGTIVGNSNQVAAAGSMTLGSGLTNTVAGTVDIGPDNPSKVTVAVSGTTFRTNIFASEIASSPTPSANTVALYAKDKSGTSALYFKNDAGTETEIGSGGSLTVKTNDITLGTESILNFKNGANVTITGSTGSGSNVITIASTAGGGINLVMLETFLSSAASAGATSVSVQTVPSNFVARSGYIVIQPYSTNCEIRQISSISGTTINITGDAAYPLDYAHEINTPVLWIPGGTGIPWTWFGGRPNSTAADDVAVNVTAFNRLSTNLYKLTLRGPAEIIVPAGTFYVDKELKLERDIAVKGMSSLVSIIAASDNFTNTFTGDGEVAVIHPQRDGSPVIYAQPGPSARWFLADFMVDGRNLTNANGVLISPQQPQFISNMRFQNFTNSSSLYGLAVVDCQDAEIHNIQFLACNVSMRYRSVGFVECYGFNSEQAITGDFIGEKQGSNDLAMANNSFYGVHLESPLTANKKYFEIREGDGWKFDTVWVSNLDTNATLFYFNVTNALAGYPIFTLENIIANQNSYQFTNVHDIQRGRALDSFTTKRRIKLLESGIDGTNWSILLAGFNSGHAGATDTPVQFGSGIQLGFTNGPILKLDQLQIPNGSAAEPSVVFQSDDDGSGTGMFRPFANEIGFSINGVQQGSATANGFGVAANKQFESLSSGAGLNFETGGVGDGDAILFTSGGTKKDVIIGTSASTKHRAMWAGTATTLTEATATTVATIDLAASKFIGVQFFATVNANDGTDFQAVSSTVSVDAVNKGGTLTIGLVSQADTGTAASAGTLVVTWTAVANGAAVDLKANATSSLTQTTLACTIAILAVNSDGTSTIARP